MTLASLISERGSEKAMDFESIYNTYYNDIYLFVLSLSKNPSVAEEITQETFFKALKSFNGFSGKCKITVWLCQIAKNTYFSHCEKNKRYSDVSLELLPDENDFTHTLLTKEYALQLHRILHRLEEPYKEVFTLRVFGELSFKEIGQILEKTENWARVIYYRSKPKIQSYLKEEIK